MDFDADEGELALSCGERSRSSIITDGRLGRDGRSLRSGFFGGWQFAGSSATPDARQKENLACGRERTWRRRPSFAAFNTEGQTAAKLAGAEQVLSDIAKAETSAYPPAVDRKRKSTATQVDVWRMDPESANKVRFRIGIEKGMRLDACDGSNREFLGGQAPANLQELLRFRRNSADPLRGNGSQAEAFRGGDQFSQQARARFNEPTCQALDLREDRAEFGCRAASRAAANRAQAPFAPLAKEAPPMKRRVK